MTRASYPSLPMFWSIFLVAGPGFWIFCFISVFFDNFRHQLRYSREG
ncbi:MAG TPA: hypothetical protein VME46_03085 [Acidimicrobiales bacterium]|nr:hypothetical protein [Acidimicrobiales bacterium]